MEVLGKVVQETPFEPLPLVDPMSGEPMGVGFLGDFSVKGKA